MDQTPFHGENSKREKEIENILECVSKTSKSLPWKSDVRTGKYSPGDQTPLKVVHRRPQPVRQSLTNNEESIPETLKSFLSLIAPHPTAL